ncbi:RNase P modulator RnpM [Alicyclobacillus mengziensis]|uniref:YlxR family protein n=1 Tax=Alicyclobacillus mengziensis TaxID=2931921 RepID=A0A9X7Z3W7_9BACL|nr:YlxR family protein [Alicyclobacillus mengziensis]QSO45379.1 YlxR family protein [Alicyclobacillus mengziensis]
MQKVRKVPLRKCVGCQEMSDKRQLLRVVLTPEGEVLLDPTGKQNGRGAYLHGKLECLQLARKKKSLERALKTMIPDTVYDRLALSVEGVAK